MKSNHFSSAAFHVAWSFTVPIRSPSGRPNFWNAWSKISSYSASFELK